MCRPERFFGRDYLNALQVVRFSADRLFGRVSSVQGDRETTHLWSSGMLRGMRQKCPWTKSGWNTKPHHTRKTYPMLVKGTSSSAAETHAFIVENDLDSNVISAPPEASILYIGVGRTRKDVLEATPLECDWGLFTTGNLVAIRGSF